MADDKLATLLCPKCVSQMLPVQRFGVQIDQCTGYGGVFLDRGEMEQLAQAEAKFYAAAQPQQASPQQYAASPPPGYYEPPPPRRVLRRDVRRRRASRWLPRGASQPWARH